MGRGLCGVLQIDLNEVGVSFRRAVGGGDEIILYDKAPGGAGLVNEARQRWGEIVSETHRIVTDCDCKRACYDCLKDFANQTHHRALTHNTPTGLAAKDDYRILVSNVLNLLYDAIETCAALVFFQIPGESKPRPLTSRWEELVEPIAAFQSEYGNMKKKLSDLTNETLRHPET